MEKPADCNAWEFNHQYKDGRGLMWRTDSFRLNIRQEGESNLYTAPLLKKVGQLKLTSNPELRLLHIDLSACTSIDSTSLGVLVGFAKRMLRREDPGMVYLTIDDWNLRKVFEVEGLEQFFTFVKSDEEELDWETILNKSRDRIQEHRNKKRASEIFIQLSRVAQLIQDSAGQDI